MYCISQRSDVLLWEGMLNPMMSSFNRLCRLPDSKVIRLTPCSLPLNGDCSRLRLTNSLLLLHFAIFSCLWYFNFLQGDFWLSYRKHLLSWEQSYKALNTFQSVPSYCVAHKEDVQWKAGLPWDFIWLIYNDGNHYKQPMLIHWLFVEWPLCVMNAPS